MGMETFTFRIPKSWTERITGRQVRTWIRDYLAAPGPLRAVSEDLTGRVSLRLRGGSVRELAHRTKLSPSGALRRVIANRLRITLESPVTVPPMAPAQPKDTDIVSEELLGEGPYGGVIILERDRSGRGYQRSLPIDRETYLKARRG